MSFHELCAVIVSDHWTAACELLMIADARERLMTGNDDSNDACN